MARKSTGTVRASAAGRSAVTAASAAAAAAAADLEAVEALEAEVELGAALVVAVGWAVEEVAV